DAHSGILNEPDGRDLVTTQNLKLIVFDPTKEVVVQWIE
ncbi:fatty-acid synthase, partial [Candidatus Poribacteria bacterium]|nr:fatty-acid synthase [Candidatus Poribacteria bacterium]